MSEILHLPVCGNVGALICAMKPTSAVAVRISHLVDTGGHAETACIRPTEYLPAETFNPAAGDDYAERY